MLQCKLGFHRVLERTPETFKKGRELSNSGIDKNMEDLLQGNYDNSKTILDYIPKLVPIDGKILNKITGKGDIGKIYDICLGYPTGSATRKLTFGELVKKGISPLRVEHAELTQYIGGSCERCPYFAKDKKAEGKGLLSSEEEVERLMAELMKENQ